MPENPASQTISQEETYSDRLMAFSIPARDVRGRVVRLDEVLDTVLAAHDYPPAIKHLLAEALVIATLIGALVKRDEGQMTMQAQTDGGVVKLLVCDYRGGELRGYVDFDRERLASLGANPGLPALFAGGYLAITFDMADGRGRYQGIVPLEADSLAEACESYFLQSEQVPTQIRIAVRSGPDGCSGAGLLIQHMADGEEGRERIEARQEHPHWEHVSVMAGSVRHEELLDPEISLEALLWRLFHEEDAVRTTLGPRIVRGCRCSQDYYRTVLARFPEEDLRDMRDESGNIPVDCAFCSKIFSVAA
ncbi:Hsp33 family molecular chaperone HslO [Erythrobacter sp. LQ02-29]|uniref:Hsp33 family molecular chaperone HslO n=1 Tax=Erythrobacter sp. LQ02-29 TaxID=2920384 RepID=UPI001F4E17B9|nr:Hsp33 family molecular chaperone HslO [Erythrobacter sp. LQ02-29]MCP9221705.1 Hsp33 family molecular chaperone HslO [Erythrobacter sp. LQ02-29]